MLFDFQRVDALLSYTLTCSAVILYRLLFFSKIYKNDMHKHDLKMTMLVITIIAMLTNSLTGLV